MELENHNAPVVFTKITIDDHFVVTAEYVYVLITEMDEEYY